MQAAKIVPMPAVGPRLVLSALAALLLLSISVVRVAPAQAQVSWCWNDPALIVNGGVVLLNLGVPQSEAGTVTDSTLTVTVPAGVSAILAGGSANHFITRLRINVELVVDPTSVYTGTGPVPVRVDAVINAPASTATALKASQRANSVLGQIYAKGGQPMTINFDVK